MLRIAAEIERERTDIAERTQLGVFEWD